MPQTNQQPPSSGDEWVRANTAARRFGVPVSRLTRLALAGEIRTLVEPGSTPRFSVADVERVAGRSA